MKKHLIIGAFFVCLSVVGFTASAHASEPLSGWGWSSNIGWISFNSSDANTGPNGVNTSDSDSYHVSYHVNISTTTVGSDVIGTFDNNSYAWSPNVGWISFVPSDAAACGPAASVDLTSGAVTGWVRVYSGIGYGAWDGCIKLSDAGVFSSPDATGNHGVTYHASGSQGIFNGFAWDSGALGWLSFDPGISGSSGVIVPSCPACEPPPAAPSVALEIVDGSNSPVSYVTAIDSAGDIPPVTAVWSVTGAPTVSTAVNPDTPNVTDWPDGLVTGGKFDSSGSELLSSSPNFMNATQNPITRKLVLQYAGGLHTTYNPEADLIIYPYGTVVPNYYCPAAPTNSTLCPHSNTNGNSITLYNDNECPTVIASCQYYCSVAGYTANGLQCTKVREGEF